MMLILAALLAQAAATALPPAVQAPAAQPAKVKKAKPQQNCEYVEITGSRSRRRVCHDDNGNLQTDAGIQSGTSDQMSGLGSTSH